MKILHISTFDNIGGAARATYRIHQSLQEIGVHSFLRVVFRSSEDKTVTNYYKKTILKILQEYGNRKRLIKIKKMWHHSNKEMHSYGTFGIGIVDEINKSDADIVHLHWINEMLSIVDIGKIKKPIVWTMHDMWPFCGAEHYAFENENNRFCSGYLETNRDASETGIDLNRKTWLLKKKHWKDLHFSIVSTSNWLNTNAKNSFLFNKSNHYLIPYPLETSQIWKPIEKAIARKALSLPENCHLVLMGADGGISNPRKGGDLLNDAIDNLSKIYNEKVELVIFGQSNPNNQNQRQHIVHWLGDVKDDRILALAYSAADVMIVPSRQEAFGQTATESLACGTPVVAFDIGGLSDIVIHQENGWLSPAFDTNHMAEGIKWILKDKIRYQKLSSTARQFAVERYNPNLIAEKYLEVYRQVLEKHHQS